MDDARQQLKDLGDRIQAAMDRHGITQAEICIRRLRWRMRETARHFDAVSLAADEACLAAREMSQGLLRQKRI